MTLAPGDPAPAFTLPATTGTLSLADLAGRRAVLFFFPQAMTPACSMEAAEFQAALPAFREAGYDVVGISPDPVDRLVEFAGRDGLSYPLASDEGRQVMAAYGAHGEKNLYGRTVTAVIRSSVVLAPDGTVEHAFHNVKATGHVARLRRELGV